MTTKKQGPNPPKYTTEARRVQVLKLTMAGFALPDIRKTLTKPDGSMWNFRTLHKDRQVALAKWWKEAFTGADEVLALTMSRLEFMWSALYPKMQKGNVEAINAGLRILEKITKLSGLDQPDIVINQEYTHNEMRVEFDSEALTQKAMGIAAALAEAGVLELPPLTANGNGKIIDLNGAD
jgi:hypothetical protein